MVQENTRLSVPSPDGGGAESKDQNPVRRVSRGGSARRAGARSRTETSHRVSGESPDVFSFFFFEKLTLLAILLLLSLCKTAAICVDVKGVIF